MFTGKVVIVTGAASGIGRSVALLYASHGAKVVVSDVSDQGGQESVNLIEKAGGEAIYQRADVSDPSDCEALVQKAVDVYGKLDIACNNAGIGGDASPVGDLSTSSWDRVIAINLSGVFYCMKYQIQAMVMNGSGAIVNMSSILGQVGFPNSAAYVAAKHGLEGLTKTAAVEYAARGIRINSVGPAFIRTPLIAALEDNPVARDSLISKHPIGRLGEPGEVAELVIWLSSEKASFVTGSYYAVDGGYLAV